MKEMNDQGEELTKNQAKYIYLWRDWKLQKTKTEDKERIILKFA